MGKKKRIIEDEYRPGSVLAKPISQEEKEMMLRKRRNHILKIVITIVVITVLVAGSVTSVVIIKPWQYIPRSPTLVIKEYISALNDRNFDEISKCMSTKMLEATESNAESQGGTDALFNSIFNDDLKEKYGDDVAFSVNNFTKEKQQLEDGVYDGENVTELYGITDVVIVTCDIVTSGSLGSISTTTYITCVKIDRDWYIQSMSE